MTLGGNRLGLAIKEIWRHKKRGSRYTVISFSAKLQNSNDREVEEKYRDVEWTVYQDYKGNIFFRPTAEFLDGRFDRA
jgi:hypothetical protein